MELTHLAEKEVLIDQNSTEHIEQQIGNLIRENKIVLRDENIICDKELYAKLNHKLPLTCRIYGQFNVDKIRARLQNIYGEFYGLETQTIDNQTRKKSACFFFLRKDLLVSYEESHIEAAHIFYPEDLPAEELETLIKVIRNNKREQKSRVNIVVQDYHIRLIPLKLKRVEQDISQLYNDDFSEVHQYIYGKLSMKEVKGLVLLHGTPGTGKTSYIRYLAHKLRKKIIFLPPDMYTSMNSHSLMELLNASPNSIIIIEDAEYLLKDRNSTGNPFLASILNIADGLISDSLNICFICTFNSTLTNIDQAVLRKGRLIANYEFKPLTVEKANHLLKNKGADINVTEPTSLADIFYYAEPDYKGVKKTKLGF